MVAGDQIRWLRFLDDSQASVEALRNHELVCKVFVRYNAALPSSASVEQVFSGAADILTRKIKKDGV